MHKITKIKRSTSDKALAEAGASGDIILPPMFSRSLQKCQELKRNYLVSRYIGGTFAVVTHVYSGNIVKQHLCLTGELQGEDHQTISTTPLHAGTMGYQLNPDGSFTFNGAEKNPGATIFDPQGSGKTGADNE